MDDIIRELEEIDIEYFENVLIYETDDEYQADDYSWLEEETDDYASNMACDTWGFCSGSSCPNYIRCGGR